jgi:CheY-like chemotaxis protein
MDVQMPEMDGFEATARIRAGEQGSTRRLPVIAMTAHALAGDRERCLAAGMDGYIAKPLQPRKLLEAVEGASPGCGGEDAPLSADLEPDFDRTEALRRAGGDESLLRDLVQVFLGTYPAALAELHEAFTRQDGDVLRRVAHRLKGEAGTIGARNVARAAQCLEVPGGTGRGNAQALATLREALRRAAPLLVGTLGRTAAVETARLGPCVAERAVIRG